MTNKMTKRGLLIVLTVIAFACTKAPVIEESEKEWLRNHPNLTVGISPNQPPYQFINEKGAISGMFIDFLTIIEDRLDFKFKKIYQNDWTKLLSDAKEGNVDIVLEIQETDERKEYLNFTPFLISHKHVIVVKNTRKDIASVSDLSDKKIVVVNSFAIQGYLLKNYPGYSVIPLYDNVTGLRAVSTAQADAFITQQAVATYYIETEGISNLEIAGEIDYPNELGIASRKNLDTLNIILSKAVNSITKTEKQNIYSKWLSYEIKPFYSKAKFWIVVLVVILGVLTLAILFNLALRKRVKQKTKELTTTKEKVEESEERYRSLMLNLETGIVVHAPDTSILLNNTKASELLGISNDQIKGKTTIDPAWKFVTENNTPLPLEEYPVSQIVSNKKPIRNQILGIHRTRNNDVVWVLVNGFPSLNDKGEIIEIIISFIDITERKKAEEKLEKQNLYIKMILDNFPIGIATNEIDSMKVTYMNRKFSEFYGWPEDEFPDVGIFFEKVFPEMEYRQQMQTKILADLSSGDIDRMNWDDLKITTKTGDQRIVHAFNIPLPDQNIMVSTVQDVTERKQAEMDVMESQTELIKALESANQSRQTLLSVLEDQQFTQQKLNQLNAELEQRVAERTTQLQAANKELETFTYSVSHDLKAPLRGIDGYSKLLLELYGKGLNEEAQSFLKTIRSSTLQMNQLIDELLEYSRLERSQIRHQKIRIKDLIRSITSSYKNELDVGKYLLKVEVPDIELMSDTKGITIALRNLIENAIKFTRGKPSPTIEIGLEERASSWLFRVKDNGIGFDMKYHQRIFEIFQRLHRAEDVPGTGIGLAMVSKAMQRMNGKVWAESALEIGSTFYLEIPKTN